jgi:hypothetical protein
MATEKMIKGRRCRYYTEGYIWVSEDGTLVAAKQKSGYLRYFDIKTDGNGEKFVYTGYRYIYVKKAVFTCFCHCDDPNKTQIWYKDGNPANLHYKNLIAREPQTFHTTVSTFKLLNGLTVTEDGRIFNGKEKKHISDCIGDQDTDLMSCILPYISAPNKRSGRLFMDDLMAAAGYVAGEKYDLKFPVILHKDNNPSNFHKDNLEWVEASDPRYIEFQEKVKEWKHQRNVELNPGKRLPPGW